MIYRKYIKRFLDIIISLFSIALLIPLFTIIAILIKIDSKGEVIFKQERLGKNGKEFEIFKFRTMVKNAENLGTGINTFQHDPRITKVGAWLRKTSLDELPQLFNVLKGDMSIVGPRPPVPYHPKKYDNYSDFQVQRFRVKPGITGYAQVKGRNNLNWDERVSYDVDYVKRLSFSLDVKILWLTFIKVIKREDIHSNKRIG